MPPRPPATTASIGVPKPQTKHVQVTSIIYITAGIPAMKAAQPTPVNSELIMASHSAMNKSSSRQAAPDATGVIFRLYQPPETTTMSNDPGTPNHGAIIGGISGGLAFLVLCLIIVALRRKKSRYQKRSPPKTGSSRLAKHMSTHDAINEAHRCRKERNHHNRDTQVHNSPYGLAPADMAEMVHQGNVMVAEKHAHRSFGDIANHPSRPVAVAVAGAGRARHVRSDRPDSATLPARDDFDEIDLSGDNLGDIESSRDP